MNAARLMRASGDCHVYLLGGGIEAWKRAGLPTSNSTGRPAAAQGAPQGGGLMDRISSLFR